MQELICIISPVSGIIVLIFGDYMKQIKELSKMMGFKVLEG